LIVKYWLHGPRNGTRTWFTSAELLVSQSN